MSFGRFELINGLHTEGSAKNGTRKVYYPRDPKKGKDRGDIVEARSEKEAKFFKKYPEKFVEIHGPEPVEAQSATVRKTVAKPTTTDAPPVDPTIVKTDDKGNEVVEIDMDKLKDMSARDLLIFAKNNGIDVKGAVVKEAIIKNIEAALSE